jgi:hypothetical protein
MLGMVAEWSATMPGNFRFTSLCRGIEGELRQSLICTGHQFDLAIEAWMVPGSSSPRKYCPLAALISGMARYGLV